MSETPKIDYFLVPGNPGPCPLCSEVAPHQIYYSLETRTPRASFAADRGARGKFGISKDADDLLKAKPKARPGIREQIKLEHFRGGERPLIMLEMVDYFSAGGRAS